MPLMGEQAVFGSPFFLPSQSPQFKSQNSLMGSSKGQPIPTPGMRKLEGYLVVRCSWGGF